jgi:PAS domain S-box-containing protein
VTDSTRRKGPATADAGIERQSAELPPQTATDRAALRDAQHELREAQDELRDAEVGLDIALEAADMGAWQLDVARDVAPRRSVRHDQLFGYATPQPAWGKEIAKRHVLEEDRAAYDAAFARARETGVLAFEVRVRWPDGSVHWMAARGRFFFDAQGNAVRGVGVNFDVTERREAETRLREAEERYLALFTAIDQGFCTLEVRFDANDRPVDYRFLEVSPSFERQTGIVNGAGRWMRDIAPEQDETWFERYGRVARTGEPARFEEHSTPLGRWWNVYAFRIGDPATRRVGVLFHDITERKHAEAERERLVAALGAERERLRSVILHTPAPLALLEGPEHRFTLVNEAYKRVSGGGRDVTGLTPPEAFPELAGSGIYELFDRVYETGQPWDGPESLVRYDRDGTGVQDTWFNLRFEPVRDAEGRVVAIFNFAVDVTEQVRARQQVEELLRAERTTRAEAEASRRAAEAANRAKSEFLAVMSHELRTPLNAIGGYAELIELGIHGPVTDAQRATLERIQRSQRHLLGLIAGVLDYSRVEAGAVTYRLADVPVTEAVAEAETLVAPQLRAKGLGYTWSGAAPDLAVRADREKLQQILLNLLGNAVKFTNGRDGTPGRIEVACTVDDGVGPATTGGCVHLHVRDTGHGIASDQLERVFEPFVQVDQRLTRPHAGVGLGLAISRDLARGMGGDLTARSTPDVGSTFTLTLPRA